MAAAYSIRTPVGACRAEPGTACSGRRSLPAPAGAARPQADGAADGDCDDANQYIYPGATERCDDGKDGDCDGQIDEGCDDDCGNSFDTGIAYLAWHGELAESGSSVDVTYGLGNGAGTAGWYFREYDFPTNGVDHVDESGSPITFYHFLYDSSGNPYYYYFYY